MPVDDALHDGEAHTGTFKFRLTMQALEDAAFDQTSIS
jgi:hypothetical protein